MLMKRAQFGRFLTYIAGTLLLCACSASRDLPEGVYMLNRIQVLTDSSYKDVSPTQMKSYVRQKPNSRWFSTVRIPLGVYAMAGKDSSWVNRLLRSMGEAPVVYDSALARQTCRDLQLALQNKGYLDAEVAFYLEHHKKKIDAIYLLHPGQPYFVQGLERDIQDSVIAGLLKNRKSLLYDGMQFNTDVLNNERSEIAHFLQDQGYFRFHKEFITYTARKDEQNHQVMLGMILHPYRSDNESNDTLHSRYMIRQITYGSGMPDDSIIHLRQSVLKENTFLEEGRPYSASGLQNTYNHFGRLGAVRYTNISFQQVPDTALLDTRIMIQTNKPSSISFQPEGTNTAGDFGAAASLTYQNRNLFKGSETFSLKLRGAYEAIRGLEGYSNQDFVEYSIEGRVSFPRFVLPFLSEDIRRRLIATSELSVMYDSQDRPEFHRRILSAAWRYKWQPQNHHDSYRIDFVDLNYVFMPWVSETFRREYLDNPSNPNAILSYNYKDLFIMKTGFGYSYSNRRLSIRTNLEAGGNLLNLYTSIFGGNKNSDGQYKVFDIAYAQYVKADVDFSHNLLSQERQDQLVFHVGLGVAYPYGNSTVLPFEKRYFSGGANSVRGWTVRSLGPGNYKDKDGRINFITQTGDMKLDLNLEYRTHLFWKFGGAAFIDAGNIWTLRNYESQPGGQFTMLGLWQDLAVSYGLGLRLNFEYFVLRFDLGMKAINPAYKTEDEAHYPLIHPRMSRDFAFHFAVGMPF